MLKLNSIFNCIHFNSIIMLKDVKQRQKRVFALIFIIVLICFLYYSINLHSFAWYANDKFLGETHRCTTPAEEMQELKLLIRDVHTVLNEVKLTHILIYGSLWGALRYKDPLPWDNDVDMALIEEEMRRTDFNTLKEMFYKKNIEISYRLWLGTYRVTRGKTARGDLMVFRKSYFGDMWRTGIEPWVFFVNYRRFHTFPASLIERPLPKLTFAGVNISVPRKGNEIQKHFYPHDWWKESRPKGC